MKKVIYIFMLMLILAPYMGVAIKASEIIEKEVLVTADNYYEPQIDDYESGKIKNKDLEPIYDLEAKAKLDEETKEIKYEAIISHKAGTYADLEKSNLQIDGLKKEEINNIKISYIVDGKEEEVNTKNINIEDKYRVTTNTNQNVDKIDLEFTTPVTEEMNNKTPEVEFTFNYKGDKEYFVTDKTNIIELDENLTKESQNIEEPKEIDPKLTTQMDKGDLTNSKIATASEYSSYYDTQYNYNGLSIGYEVPDNDSGVTFDGTPIGDDITGATGIMDDENGFGSKADYQGILDFTVAPGEKITLSVPYKFTKTLTTALGDDNVGKISMWIDFDQDGTFSEDEYAESIITDQETNYEFTNGNSYAAYPKTIIEFTIPQDVKVGSTKLHTVLTTEQDSVTATDGNITDYPGYGEIEDYQADFYLPEDCTTTPYLNNNVMLAESVEQISPTEIMYENIENPGGANFNMDFVLTLNTGDTSSFIINTTPDFETGKYLIGPTVANTPNNSYPTITVDITNTVTGNPINVPFDIFLSDLDNEREWWKLISGIKPEIIGQKDSKVYTKVDTDGNLIIIAHKINSNLPLYNYIEGSYTSTNVETDGSETLVYKYGNTEPKQGTEIFGFAGEYSTTICPNTTLTKELTEESEEISGVAEDNEDLTYTLTVKNDTDYDAFDVAIRDSMLENLPSYITYDGNVSVNPDVGYTGSLSGGTFVLDTVPANSSVEIEYTVNVGEIPEDVETVLNIVTDNGEDPSTCDIAEIEDCIEVEIPTEVITNITKEIVDESGEIDEVVEDNEDITYKVVVTNDTINDGFNIAVRDSMLENLPEYIEYDGNVSVNPDVGYTGSLSGGTFVLDTVPANSSVEIEYTVHIGEIPDDVATVLNIVTDNGDDPSTCDITDIEDCIEVEIPTEVDTELSKEIIDESGEIDQVAESNEDITYKVVVTNNHTVDAEDVAVRDSMLENLPEYIEYDGNVSVNPDLGYAGSLSGGTFVLDTVPANSSVEIEYTVNVGEIPDDVETVLNIVTDNGEDPSTCDIAEIEDCIEVEIPTEVDTELTKEITNESGEIDGIAESNEDITYKVVVTNNHTVDAVDVAVRDSMLENLPEYIEYDGNVSVNPGVGYTGSLEDGTFVLDTVPAGSSVEIEYTVNIGEIPDDVETVLNIVTDNGEDPSTCDIAEIEDCIEVEIPTEVDTELTKEIVNESGEIDGEAENDEDITYKVVVTNNHTVDAEDVAVRDSMLENLPEYIEYDGNVSVNPDVGYTGSLEDGTFVLDTVPAGSSVEIEYTVNVGEIPEDVETVLNIVTDNGEDPSTCDLTEIDDCIEVEIPTKPKTSITKEIVDESVEIDQVAESNEDITYKITVTNDKENDGFDIAVRDSMLENLPEYIEYDGNVSVNPDVGYTGSLEDGTFVLDTVPAGSSVEIEYTVNVGEIPEDVETVLNIVTDNGEDPSTCDLTDIDDCIEVEIPTEVDTELTKEIVDESIENDEKAENDEDITYKITVTNNHTVDAVDVAVRDSMLESLPNYVTYDGNVVVNPNNITYTGSLEDGTFVLDTVPASSSVEIEYTVNVGEIPEDVETVLNIATDNGEDPSTCDLTEIEDCVEVEIPIKPNTELTKEITNESGEIDGQAENGEDITYKVTVTNNHTVDAEDVAVRDSMLENLPEYIEYDGNVSVNPGVGYTGNLSDGTFVLDTVPAGSSVEIEYTVNVGEIPEDVETVLNIVTDNGEDPSTCDLTDTEDCVEIEIPVVEIDEELVDTGRTNFISIIGAISILLVISTYVRENSKNK